MLARDIVDMDQVSLTALGVTSLVEHLRSSDDNVIILTGEQAFMFSNILRVVLIFRLCTPQRDTSLLSRTQGRVFPTL